MASNWLRLVLYLLSNQDTLMHQMFMKRSLSGSSRYIDRIGEYDFWFIEKILPCISNSIQTLWFLLSRNDLSVVDIVSRQIVDSIRNPIQPLLFLIVGEIFSLSCLYFHFYSDILAHTFTMMALLLFVWTVWGPICHHMLSDSSVWSTLN